MKSVPEIIRLIGVSDLSVALGVGETAIFNAVSKGQFPAPWRDVLEEACEPLGVDVRSQEFKSLFNMKRGK